MVTFYLGHESSSFLRARSNFFLYPDLYRFVDPIVHLNPQSFYHVPHVPAQEKKLPMLGEGCDLQRLTWGQAKAGRVARELLQGPCLVLPRGHPT